MALNLVRAGKYTVTMLEKGPRIASHIQDYWSHVNLFSSNSLNMSATGRAVISEQGGVLPDADVYFSGGEFVEHYLQPLEKYLRDSGKCDMRFNNTVVSVGRKEAPKDKKVSDRASRPFQLLCSHGDEEYYVHADVGECVYIASMLIITYML
jgi:hypothetical protein